MKPLHLNRPHLLIVTGIPGSGKSAFSDKFSETFGAPIVSDRVVRQVDPEASAQLRHAVVDYQLQQVLLTGTTVIVDSHTANRKQRAEMIKLAKKSNYNPLVVWVQTDETTAKRRATKKSAGKYTAEQFETGLKNFTAPKAPEPVVVVSGKHTYASQARVVLSNLANKREDSSSQPLQAPKRRGSISVR